MAFNLENITLGDIILAAFAAGFTYREVRSRVKRNGNGHGAWGEVVTALQGVVDALGNMKAADRAILQEVREHNVEAEAYRKESRETTGGQGRALAEVKTTVLAIQSQVNNLR